MKDIRSALTKTRVEQPVTSMKVKMIGLDNKSSRRVELRQRCKQQRQQQRQRAQQGEQQENPNEGNDVTNVTVIGVVKNENRRSPRRKNG